MVFLAFLAGAGCVAWQVDRAAAAKAARRFEEDGNALVGAIQNRLLHYAEAMRGTQGIFMHGDPPNRAEWGAYMDVLALPERYPGARSLAWIPCIPREHLAAFEASMRAQGLLSFRVWDLQGGPAGPLGERDTYHPIAFIEPSQPAARGFDTASRPRLLKEVIETARDRGETLLHGRISPVEDPKDISFALVAPVYRNGGRPQALDQRRSDFLGHISCLVSSNRFFRDLTPASGPALRLAVYDDSETGADTLLWDSEGASAAGFEAQLDQKRNLVMYGRRWVLRLWSTPAWEEAHLQRPLGGILALGLALAVGCGGGVAWLLRGRLLAEARLAAHGGELEAMRDSLQRETQARKQADQAKAGLVSMVSRELRAPLTALRGGIRLLSTPGTLRPDQEDYVSLAGRNLERLVRVVDNLVDQEALAKGELTIELGVIPLGSALEEAQVLVRPQVEGQKVVVHVDAPEGLRVRGDGFRFRQVLVSLVSQAVESSKPGSELWLWADPPREGRVRVSLHDPSRPAGSLEPGKDADLSLMHAKAVMEAMGGRFGAVDVEKGHTLWMELPVI